MKFFIAQMPLPVKAILHAMYGAHGQRIPDGGKSRPSPPENRELFQGPAVAASLSREVYNTRRECFSDRSFNFWFKVSRWALWRRARARNSMS